MDAVYVTYTPTPFSAATGAKTLLKLITPTTFNIKIHSIKVSFNGTTASDAPAVVEWGTSTEATAGTSGVTPTTTQIKGATIAHGLTTGSNFTAEGTVYTVQDGLYVPQYMGIYEVQIPLGLEPVSPAGLADSFFVRVNTSATVSVIGAIKWSRA